MQSVKGRLGKLERTLAPRQGKRILVVTGGYFGPTNLASSTCTRTRTNGVLIDFVTLDGCADDLSNEELEEFVHRFPIQEQNQPPRKWA